MLLRRTSPWPEKVEDLDGKFSHHCYMNTDFVQWPIDEILSDEGLSPLNDMANSSLKSLGQSLLPLLGDWRNVGMKGF